MEYRHYQKLLKLNKFGMKFFFRLLWACFFVSVSITYTHAQPFANEIAAFKKQDSISFPEKNKILFVGSSSFTNWKDVQNYFPNYPIINRGFGGSTLLDIIRYQYQIIYPYYSKQIVIYCGENDIASSEEVSSEMVAIRFKILFNYIREQMPNVPIAFISLKPSPSRWQMKDRMVAANKLIKKILQKESNATFINVWDAMLDSNGSPMPNIFVGDNLHLNEKGYAIWQKIIEPYLIK